MSLKCHLTYFLLHVPKIPAIQVIFSSLDSNLIDGKAKSPQNNSISAKQEISELKVRGGAIGRPEAVYRAGL